MPEGTLLGDSYRIRRRIGSGGFGVTYEAEDITLGTSVAVKEYYPREFGARDESLTVRPRTDEHTETFDWGRTSFLQEARTLVRFRHPSIVEVTRVFEERGTVYMVMAYESGLSLERWLAGLDSPPTQEELDQLAMPLLEALEQMHAEGFIHRDIAPDNIIVRPDGTPVLLDFGAARRTMGQGSHAVTGLVKAGYSPQEQYAVDSRLQGPWSDCYAFGATFYLAVTGKAPEEAPLRNMEDRLQPAASAAIGAYREGFLAAIDQCLKMAPEARPQTVTQLRALLFAEPPATTTAAQPATPSESPAAPARTSAWLAAAMVVVLGGAGYGAYRYLASPEQGPQAPAPGLERSTEEETRRAAAADIARKKAEDEERHRAHLEKAASAWALIKNSDDPAAIEQFLSLYADTPLAEPARARLADLKQIAEQQALAAAAWNALSASSDIAELEKFIAAYPATRQADLARARILELNRALAQQRERLAAICRPTRLGDDVLKSCSDLVAQFPSAEAHALRGDHYRRLSQYDNAVADLTRALELDDQDAFARSRRGSAYARRGSPGDAQSDFSALLAKTPTTARDFEARGEAYWTNNNLEAAIEAYTKAIELDPTNALAYAGRAMVFDKQQQYDRAIADSSKAIALEPLFAEAYNVRGIAHGAKQQADRALADYTKALELYPKFVHALSNLCFAYEQRQQYDRAIAYCNKAIEIDPKFANAYTNRGVIHMRRGQADRAFTDFSKVVELKPKDANALSNRGVAFHARGDRTRAIADFRLALQLDPKHKDARDNLMKLGVPP